jgi:hypothetical protein
VTAALHGPRAWSLRYVAELAGVTHATARSVARAGHVDPTRLAAVDVLVLQAASMLGSLQPVGEARPANTTRVVLSRERHAIALVRAAGITVPADAVLVVTPDDATLPTTLAMVTARTIEAVMSAQPYLALPLGAWARQLRERPCTPLTTALEPSEAVAS